MRTAFLRRYATSPIHVPRLERLLAVYGAGGGDDEFAARFISWERVCSDVEAGRVVTEVLSSFHDDTGAIVRLSDAAVQGALRLMADATAIPTPARARELRGMLAENDKRAIDRTVARLERAVTVPAADLVQLLSEREDHTP